MANTGYLINPKIQQFFKTGPNSGSVVTTDFDVILSPTNPVFTTCNKTYYYKEINELLCPIPNRIIPPTLIYVETNCSEQTFIYNVSFNTNTQNTLISSSIIECSTDINFTQNTSSFIQYYSGNSSISFATDIFTLNSLPINQYENIYWRVKNIYNDISSNWSNIINAACITNPGVYVNLIKNASRTSACNLNGRLCTVEELSTGFCGDLYIIDTNDFSTANIIYTPFMGIESPGWYYNGTISRYFNGNTITETIICPTP